jgi:uncharacterized protein YjbJ (UPF0337 family)
MTGMISNIAGKINEAIGKAKQNAQDPSLHEEGVEQEAIGKGQQETRAPAERPREGG